MTMHPVNSSSIKALGFEHGVMRVQFVNGGIYDHPVTSQEFQALKSAPSIGAHYSKHHGKSGKRVG